MANSRSRYTYEDAGFNGFMRRSIASNPTSLTLADIGGRSNSQEINFDDIQTSGAIGDKFKVGKGVVLHGDIGRISTHNVNTGDETTRLGDLGD